MTITSPQGFTAAGVAAGLKSTGKPDLALVVNGGDQEHRVGVGVFTANRVVAAPVVWTRQTVADGRLDAVVLNSGGANACTGPEGFADTHREAEYVAELLGVSAADVGVCSTGLIGTRLPMAKIEDGITAAAARLSADGGTSAAEAIMTTDTRSKSVHIIADDGKFSIGGMSKGAGMLAPAMATMLCVLTTDAIIDAQQAQEILGAATAQTFDRVDSDGCMSTNDTVLLLASGASGHRPSPEAFAAALTDACADLARQLVADAEGATHDIAIRVTGASEENAALAVARSVARSNLFKAAIYGNDPNWGRVLASIGTVPVAIAPFDAALIDVSINGVRVCVAGGVGEDRSLVDLAADREVHVVVDLHAGAAEATIWTNDLTHDYVHENSAYSS